MLDRYVIDYGSMLAPGASKELERGCNEAARKLQGPLRRVNEEGSCQEPFRKVEDQGRGSAQLAACGEGQVGGSEAGGKGGEGA